MKPFQKFGIIKNVGKNPKKMCEIAGVSRAGYYRWLKSAGNKPRDYDDYLLVREMFKKGKHKYGWRTIKMKLKTEKGISMNHKKIIRIKNKYNLMTKIRRKNPYKAIMKKSREHRTFANILNRNFRQPKPRKVFCADITYLPFSRRMAYLSAVKDIASREIVAWNISQNLELDIVLDTIKNLESSQAASSFEGTLMHSDQGVHYASPGYISEIKKLDMTQSMSRKGNCVDNAPVESFFGHFKDEVDYQDCKTFEELRRLTAKYIDYYNNGRCQWNLKKMTPVEYRKYLLDTG